MLGIFLKSVEQIQIYNRNVVTGTLHDDQYTFLGIARSVLLKMKNISDKICREKENTLLFSATFFLEKRAFF